MRCPNCGSDNVADARFCGHCCYAFSTGGWNWRPDYSLTQDRRQSPPVGQHAYPWPTARKIPRINPARVSGIILGMLVILTLLTYFTVTPVLSSTGSSMSSSNGGSSGTWKTPINTKFNYRTDDASVGYQMWDVTFFITRTSDAGVVDVQMSVNVVSSNTSIDVPHITLESLTGVISGSEMMLRAGANVLGVFSFSGNYMYGTYNECWMQLHGLQVYTETNGLQLYRQ